MAGSLQRLKPILALACGFKSRSFFGNILYIVAWPYPIHNLQKIHKIVNFNVNFC